MDAQRPQQTTPQPTDEIRSRSAPPEMWGKQPLVADPTALRYPLPRPVVSEDEIPRFIHPSKAQQFDLQPVAKAYSDGFAPPSPPPQRAPPSGGKQAVLNRTAIMYFRRKNNAITKQLRKERKEKAMKKDEGLLVKK